MIVDAHCHAWRHWPYQPAVPDPESRGRVEQLLFEMDSAGVDRAIIICAGIDHNPENNGDVATDIAPYGNRLVMFADVDSRWTATYHQTGAAQRLAAIADRFGLRGFTHYLREDSHEDAAWFLSREGDVFLRVAEERRLILSLACAPHQLQTIGMAADRHPNLVILLHHMARVRDRSVSEPSGLSELVDIARCPNVVVKISGFGYAARQGVEYPYDELGPIVRTIADVFGSQRMVWGSDYPVSRRYMTYPQTLQCVRRQCGFMDETEARDVFGGTMERLLTSAGAQP